MECFGPILYIEPNDDSREMLVLLLESYGFSVVAVRTTIEALEKLEVHPFQLILLDCVSPDGPGEEFCRLLREKGIEMPIVFFSSWVHPRTRERALAAGASLYLVKPNDLGDLAARLRALLAKD